MEAPTVFLMRRFPVAIHSSPTVIFFKPFYDLQTTTHQRISVTSTCFALQTILASQDDTNLYDSLLPTNTSLPALLRSLLLADWRRDDLFQVPLLLYTALAVDPARTVLNSPEGAERVRPLIDAVLAARPKRRDGSVHPYSDYILFQTGQVLAALYDATEVPDSSSLYDEGGIAGLPATAVPEGAAAELSLALARYVLLLRRASHRVSSRIHVLQYCTPTTAHEQMRRSEHERIMPPARLPCRRGPYGL